MTIALSPNLNHRSRNLPLLALTRNNIKKLISITMAAVSLTMTALAHDPNWLSPNLPWSPPYWEDELALQQGYPGDKRDLDDKVITATTAYARCWADLVVSEPGNPLNQLYNRNNSPQEEELQGEALEKAALRDEALRQDLLGQETSNPLFRSFLYLAMYCNSSGLLDFVGTNVTRHGLLDVHVTKVMSTSVGVPAYDPALEAFVDAHLEGLTLHFEQQFFLQACWKAIPVVRGQPKKKICIWKSENELIILPGLTIKEEHNGSIGTVTSVTTADTVIEWEMPNPSVSHYTKAALRHYIYTDTFREIGRKELPAAEGSKQAAPVQQKEPGSQDQGWIESLNQEKNNDPWLQAVKEFEEAQNKAEKELGAKGDLWPFSNQSTPPAPPPATPEQAKAIIADYEAGTIAEFKAYIIGQSLPPAIKKLQQVDEMWEQVKYRVKRLAQLKVEFGLPPEEEPKELSKEEVNKAFDEAKLENEAICAMNGGHWPANWPTNPPRDGQMSSEEVTALQKAAQRRIDTVRAAHGGQLPPDWRERVVANRP
jgi:hypothetical protein